MIKPVSELVEEAKSQCECLDPESAKKFLSENRNAIILDVREPHEAAESKLPHSVNIPRGVLEMKITELTSDPETPILIHCAAGGRACLAAATLKKMGYQNVYPITAKYEDIKEIFGE